MLKILLPFLLIANLSFAITIGVPNSISSISPIKTTTAHNRYLLHLIYDGLIRFDKDNNIVPNIAKSWSIIGQKKLVIELWNDVKFSNGDKLKAEDILFSINNLCSKESNARQDFSAIAGCSQNMPQVNVESDYKVSIVTSKSTNILLYQLASLRSLVFKKIKGKLYGTGPYTVKELKENKLILAKNTHYKRSSSVKNDGLNIFFFKDEEKMFEMLKNKKLDVSLVHITNNNSKQILSNYKVNRDLLNITQTLVFNNSRSPFNNKMLRQNILKTFDKLFDTHIKCFKSNPKQKIEVAKGIIPRGLGGTISHLSNLNYTSEKFKSLGGGKEVLIEQHIGRKDSCLEKIVKEAFSKNGLKAKFKYHDSYKTLFPKYINGDFSVFIELFNFKNRESYTILKYFLTEGNKENFAKVKSPELDNFILNAINAPNPSRRYALYREANRYINDNAIVVPLYYTNTWTYYRKCLDNFLISKGVNPFIDLVRISSKSCE